MQSSAYTYDIVHHLYMEVLAQPTNWLIAMWGFVELPVIDDVSHCLYFTTVTVS